MSDDPSDPPLTYAYGYQLVIGSRVVSSKTFQKGVGMIRYVKGIQTIKVH